MEKSAVKSISPSRVQHHHLSSRNAARSRLDQWRRENGRSPSPAPPLQSPPPHFLPGPEPHLMSPSPPSAPIHTMPPSTLCSRLDEIEASLEQLCGSPGPFLGSPHQSSSLSPVGDFPPLGHPFLAQGALGTCSVTSPPLGHTLVVAPLFPLHAAAALLSTSPLHNEQQNLCTTSPPHETANKDAIKATSEGSIPTDSMMQVTNHKFRSG